jgi:pterin-4a-carbinolamine dehydratase
MLHESFIDKANRPMTFGAPPITPQRPVPIIVPVEKWEEKGEPKRLIKKFEFRRSEDRIRFVTELMDYEEQVQHHGEMFLIEGFVIIRLLTKTVEKIMEQDREYARFADALFKDIVYSP